MELEKIYNDVISKSSKTYLYLTPIIFEELINIVNRDTSNLEVPLTEQNDIRTKIVLNELAKHEAKAKGENVADEDLPYKISKEEFASAIKLSPFEQAERNKEYGIICLALLAKVYSNDYEKQTGDVLQITDIPGASDIVKVLKNNENPSLQNTAMDALVYLYRPEYKKEMTAIFKIVSNNPNKMISQRAEALLNSLDKQV